ncbi:hypothetical protein A2483_05265 [Candidatus Peregrinibacteria bacterium RIFOXYC2_FULL_33_13]|nr:MAG: hypothetical protein UR27_C0007G0032 [Candidatus Peregrinibacteria bacterium GW2011_GWA2_33_10]KKP40906.1 MAG: hypothetical protein UR30_C0003G0078 [Candidatus Peregrinibacteria bacterium GW2011_GWC2_33_13]OGJ50153.1 MAG: hypothetical protein A2229_00300 [Candidatus Peregrinibacteria bacterium RIFOXYA2_FULL_33_7]OGJ54181.1 MAG: hypothetical protein A2483_05265 [Candidatus Peregrinibacteria bacterium RIFOXYC2_FULL_33_13]
MPILDNIIITDAHEPRAELIRDFVEAQHIADIVETFIMTKKNVTEIQENFSKRINELLEGEKAVMVFFDCITGIRKKIIHILKIAELEHQIGTRKILTTCHNNRKVRRDFKKYDLQYEGIRHAQYESENLPLFLRRLESLFQPQLTHQNSSFQQRIISPVHQRF